MKKLVLVLMAVGLFSAMPAFADEHGEHVMNSKMNSEECIKECARQSESIQQKIERIQKEIKSGSKKYSPEELKKLQRNLEEANQTLNELYRR